MAPFQTKFTISIFALTAALSHGQIVATKGGYLFRVKYTAGQVIHLDSKSSIDNVTVGRKAPPVVLNAPITFRVLGVHKGLADVRVEIAPGTITGSNKPVTQAQSVSVKLDDHNRPQSKSVVPSISALPDKPMKPGATWTAILPMRDAAGLEQRMDATYRFTGIKLIDGHQVAIATYSMRGFAKGVGTMMLLTKDGSIFSNETKITLNTSGAIDEVHTIAKRRF